LHQVTPEGYSILAPPNSAISSSANSGKRARKSTPTSVEALRSQSTPQQKSEYRKQRATLRSAVSNGSVSHRSHYSSNCDNEDDENDPELERLTSETFDRLVSAHEVTERTGSSWLDPHSLLLSCQHVSSASSTVVAASSGLPRRLSVIQPSQYSSFSLQQSPALPGSVSDLSRPSTACSLTYSAANSPSNEQFSHLNNDNKEVIPTSVMKSTSAQSSFSYLQQQPLAQLLQRKDAHSGLSGIAALNNEVQAQSSECDEPEGPKQAWQYDPKHNPLALLANFSDDLF
jgi:hypothetical protein